ncbi:MAG: hypothetical protein KF690_11005, partial [Bacteroidetes bacterium]|nr:hypothetical protein [Bacteroidota bacterium]
MITPDRVLKSEYLSLPVTEMLHQPVTALIGVDTEVSKFLKKLQISSIYDLASSRHFASALAIAAAATDPNSVIAKAGIVPADWVDAAWQGKTIESLVDASPAALESLSQQHGQTLQSLLHVTTIREMAYWPPFQAATSLLLQALQLPDPSVTDPDTPLELQPRMGTSATEKRFYERLFLYHIDEEEETSASSKAPANRRLLGNRLKDLDDAIDIGLFESEPSHFKKIAYGALLKFEQAWLPLHVTLGQLLHSLALAPGESTRIAIIDWNRTSSTAV